MVLVTAELEREVPMSAHHLTHASVPEIPAPIVILPEPPTSPDAGALLWGYLDDIISRYYQRPATAAEIQGSLNDDPSGDLVPPHGLFLVARDPATTLLGCIGLRVVQDGLGEVKRVFVSPSARGRGLGGLLLDEVERAARELGVTRLRLDTRTDLVESRRLYASHGYHEVEPFNTSQYAQHWFSKTLD
jgi:GNAT superfamily N-acetyltransferase